MGRGEVPELGTSTSLAAAQEEAEGRAREGAPEGFGSFCVVSEGGLSQLAACFVLRPQVPMGFFESLPVIADLGLIAGLEGAGARGLAIAWPSELVCGGKRLGRVSMHTGYGEGGMFCVATVVLNVTGDDGEDSSTIAACLEKKPLPSAPELADIVQQSVVAACRRWEEDLKKNGAGPLAPVLEDYFDHLWLMGEEVQALYPNGNLKAIGRFAGVDIWGRATIVTSSGQEVEFSSAEARIRG